MKQELIKYQLWQKKCLSWHKRYYQIWINAQRDGDIETLRTLPPPPKPPDLP